MQDFPPPSPLTPWFSYCIFQQLPSVSGWMKPYVWGGGRQKELSWENWANPFTQWPNCLSEMYKIWFSYFYFLNWSIVDLKCCAIKSDAWPTILKSRNGSNCITNRAESWEDDRLEALGEGYNWRKRHRGGDKRKTKNTSQSGGITWRK